jgi:hypothetical protein
VRFSASRACRSAAVLLVLSLAAGRASAADPPSPLAGADAKARIALAQELKKKDPAALAKALLALGASKAKDADRDFLTQYAMQERDRIPRMCALDALSRLDKKAAAEWFKGKADGKEELPSVVALEALGLLGTKDDAAAAIELIKCPNELVAIAATNAAARLAASKDLEAIAENGLAHASDHVTDHAAWAVQDILKKSKLAVAYFEKFAGKKGDPKSVRASSTVAMLQDKLADPHDWGNSLEPVADLLAKVPATIEIKSVNEDYKKNVEKALDWLKQNMPAAEYLVRVSAKRIDIPGKVPGDFVDLTDDAVDIPLERGAWNPQRLAFHIYWMATILWQKRCGDPVKSHRGWEPALFDVYDLCVIARLYDAGPGGYSRANFMKDQVQKHPWGSQ